MSKTKLTIWCDSLIEIGCLLSLVIAPLFFNVHSDRVFEPDKLTLIRSIAVVLIAVWLVKIIDLQGWRNASTWLAPQNPGSVWRMPFVLPIFTLVVIYLLSTAFSVTPRVSWAGSYQRLQGTYTTLSYIVIFALAAHTIRRDNQIDRLITTVILVSLPIALYGMLQRFGLDPLPWGGDVQNRIAGHMGNAIFIAAYLIMAVPLTISRIITSFANILMDEDLNPADVVRSSIYIFALAVQLIAIWWSGSRGPQLGLGVGLFAFVLIFLVALRNTAPEQTRYGPRQILLASFPVVLIVSTFLISLLVQTTVTPSISFIIFISGFGISIFSIIILLGLRQGWSWLWFSWIQIAILGGIWLVGFNLIGSGPAQMEAQPAEGVNLLFDTWRDTPGIGRLGRMLDAETETGRVRVLIWQGAMEMVTSFDPIRYPDGQVDSFTWLRPLIGYGPEAMYVAYNRYYPPELGTLEARNASPDRSHNETWDALVITGGLGFVVWQWLYITIFLHGFRWLGVVRSRLDRYLFVGLWVGLGVVTAAAFSLWRGPEYVGVAYPLGSIFGLVIYLIYYAWGARPAEYGQKENDPFSTRRITIIALLGAIMAHYVEIHFGIAIASSRIHFFVYAAVLLILGHILPENKRKEASSSAAEATPRRAGRGRRAVASGGSRRSTIPPYLGPVFVGTIVLGMIVATLGFNFVIFTPQPGQSFQSLQDLPSTGEIFYQSLFINPSQEFSSSPFIYLLIVMTWLLGIFALVSEMVKSGTLSLPKSDRKIKRAQPLAITFFAGGVIGLLAAGYGFLNASTGTLSPLQRIGFLTLSPLLTFATFYAGIALWVNAPQARLRALVVSGAGLLLGLVMLLVGGNGLFVGLIIGGLSVILIALLWDKSAAPLMTAGGITGIGSLTIGMAYTWLQANRIRANFITPESVTAEMPEMVRRVAEADQFVGILTQYYVYFFLFILVFALLFALRRLNQTGQWATIWGGLALIVLLPLSFWVVNTTNLDVIQADMIYKRGKPFDAQAGQLTVSGENPEVALRFWDNTIAIYERALEIAPSEDFYYLWLGRAYLEKSGLLIDQEREILLTTAARSLIKAQDINPLNTDHTANLARLNTRWAAVSPESDVEREGRIEAAETYYQAAIGLSPQNAIIRNEYARMVYSFFQDCEQAAELYETSATVDPFFEQTRFEQAELAAICASTASGDEQAVYFKIMLDSMIRGSELSPNQSDLAQRWLRIAQTYQQLQAYDYATQAYEAAIPFANEQEPVWRIQYFAATAYAEAGELDRAVELAEASLAAAPLEAVSQIEDFINSVE
ncbi:MAG: tetratricopeptide repeat protein [Ardenticatenaceae bacterium]|nr:tetratricopeptide repeat protein [Ardenticatenaceae bacterium]